MNVSIIKTYIKNVFIVIPEVYKDNRGFFLETYRKDQFKGFGLDINFVQSNHSGSVGGVLRGLHFQWEPPMGKLIWVSKGEGLLVAVDIRKGSVTFGKHVSLISSDENRKQLWAPAGFARGFLSLSDWCELQYMCTGIYNKNCEGGILWNDPELGIKWPIENPIISERDIIAPTLKDWVKTPTADYFKYNPNNKMV